MTRIETIAGLAVQIDEPDGGPGAGTVVLLHGWPDGAALWDDTVAALRTRWRCVRFTWPGFRPEDPERVAYPLADLVERLRQVVQAVGGGQPVTLLLHDWGCVFGHAFWRSHPQLVARIVGVDIGDAGSRAHVAELSVKAKLGIAAYQLWLALAFIVGGDLGNGMARRMAAWLRVPVPADQVRARMGHPYWITWTGAAGSYRAARPFAADEPGVPMLFVYGRRKPFLFHSRAWAQALAARPGCRVVEMPTGHWVMVDDPAGWQRVLQDWLGTAA